MSPAGRPRLPLDEEYIFRRTDEGASTYQIARELGVKPRTVQYRVRCARQRGGLAPKPDKRDLELHHLANGNLSFFRGIISDGELIEMAKSVFFSAETDRGKMLAAYIIARFSPRTEVSDLDAEIFVALNELVETGELKAVFPDKYRRSESPSSQK